MLTTQADNDHAVGFGGSRWGAYLWRNMRAVFVYEPGAVIGSQDQACFEAQRCIRKRLYDHTVSMNPSRHRLREDGDARVVRY
jgi:hypothetical protein